MTKVFAHRGDRGYFPENTLPAFESAVKLGADGIELDVHLSKDDQLIVMHDEKIDRTTDGKGLIQNYTLEELKEFDAGGWYEPRFKNTKVPTLKEVIQLLSDYDYKGMLNIEVKTDHIEYFAIEPIIAELLQTTKMSFQYMYSSFNFKTLERLEKFDAMAKKAYIFSTSEKKVKTALATPSLEAIHPKIDWVLANLTSINQTFPLKIRPWTINDPKQMKLAFEHKLEGIITDYPKEALKIRKEMDLEIES